MYLDTDILQAIYSMTHDGGIRKAHFPGDPFWSWEHDGDHHILVIGVRITTK